MFAIPTDADKSRKQRLLPMAPEFAHLLEAIPDDERVTSRQAAIALAYSPHSGQLSVRRMSQKIGGMTKLPPSPSVSAVLSTSRRRLFGGLNSKMSSSLLQPRISIVLRSGYSQSQQTNVFWGAGY